MKKHCLVLLAVLALLAASLPAQSPTPPPAATPASKPSNAREPDGPTAVITPLSGAAVTARSRKGRFDLVGLRKNELVEITVQYPAAKAGQRILTVPLDGGRVIAPSPSLLVDRDGTIRFKFKVEQAPGIYQISLNDSGRELGLQFWVRDDDPKKNPPTIND